MSVVIDLADAVVTELNSGSFSQSFTAVRRYMPVTDLQQLKSLQVSVVPRGLTIGPSSRHQNQFDYQIDIGVQQKFSPEEMPQVDALLTLVEQIGDFFRLRRLSSYPNAAWQHAENSPLYIPEHFETQRQFTSVLTLTYRLHR